MRYYQSGLSFILLFFLISCTGSIDTPPANTDVSTFKGDVLYSYSFDSADDLIDPESGGGSASLYASNFHTTTTSSPTNAWNGYSFLRVQLRNTDSFGELDDQNDAGIFIPLGHLDITGSMSVGWIARFGSTFFNAFVQNGIDENAANKITMFRVGDGSAVVHEESPQMIISPAHNPVRYHVPQISTSPNNLGRLDEFERDYPIDFSDNHTFRFEEYSDEWVYYEITNIPSQGTVALSVFTQDGNISSIPLASTISATLSSRELYAFRFIAYLHEISGADSDSYADISDIYVGDGFMGPPAGFVQ